MDKHTLYYASGTCALAAHIALIDAEIPYELKRIEFPSGDYLKPDYATIHPLHRVPTLFAPDKARWTEVSAILHYISAQKPSAKLLPGDPILHARAIEWMSTLASEAHPSFRMLYRPERYTGSSDRDMNKPVHKMGRTKFIQSLEVLSERLGDGPFCLGPAHSAVDAYFYVILSWAQRADVLDPNHPGFDRLVAYGKQIEARPSVQRALDEEAAPRPFS